MPREPDADSPVGDMSVEGETEVGPYPSLTHIENMEQADSPAKTSDGAGVNPAKQKPDDQFATADDRKAACVPRPRW
jgi:hypothetical protein